MPHCNSKVISTQFLREKEIDRYDGISYNDPIRDAGKTRNQGSVKKSLFRMRGKIQMDNFNNMWDFPVMDGVSFQKANRVHPLMQRRVEKLISHFREDLNVKNLVLFGSSLKFCCNSYSDIDLYIEKYAANQKLKPLPELDCEIDIVTNLPVDSRLYREIDSTGLLLFER